MIDFRNKMLAIHCKIYNKNFDEYLNCLNNKQIKDGLIFEFLNIYDKWEDYENLFNTIKISFKNSLIKTKPQEKFFDEMNEDFDIDFWSSFFSFSIITNLAKEIYTKNELKDYSKENGINIIDLINSMSEDVNLFIDFLKVWDFNKNSFNYKKNKIKKLIFRCIIILKEEKIIFIRKITVYNENENKQNFSNFVLIENLVVPKNIFLILKISIEPATIKNKNNICLIGFNHYSLNRYLISRKDSKKESLISINFIKNFEEKSKIKLFPDWEMIDIVQKRIEEIKKNNIEENLSKLKKLLAIKKSLLDSYEDSEEKDLIVLELTKIKYKISKIQKELSINIDFWIFEKLKIFLKNNENGLFFIPYSDFRGRSYTDSKVSPQSNWIFRFIYNYGKFSKKKENYNFLKIEENLKNKMNKIGIFEDYEILGWVLVSIGSQFKNKEDKISIEEFIDIGIDKFLKYKDNIYKVYKDLEDSKATETIYYFKILESHIKKIYIDRYLIKDSTASVYQHLGKLLYFKDEEALEITNLGKGKEWRDTYIPLISTFKSSLDDEVKEFFNRKNLKKLLFTTKYGIGSKKAFKDFQNNIGFINDKETFSKIASNFRKVYKLVNEGNPESIILYHHSISDLNKALTQEEYFELEDIKINLSYHKLIKKEINVFENKKRYSIVNYTVSEELDEKKKIISMVANCVHGLDALFARRVSNIFYKKNKKIWLNHDAFYISYNEVNFFIKVANECIKIEENLNILKGKNKKRKNYSNFIAL